MLSCTLKVFLKIFFILVLGTQLSTRSHTEYERPKPCVWYCGKRDSKKKKKFKNKFKEKQRHKEDGYEPEINFKLWCDKPFYAEMEKVRDKIKKGMLDLRYWSMRDSKLFYDILNVDLENCKQTMRLFLCDSMHVRKEINFKRDHSNKRKFTNSNAQPSNIVANVPFFKDRELVKQAPKTMKVADTMYVNSFQPKSTNVEEPIFK